MSPAAASPSHSSRKLRAFLRWMREKGVQVGEGLDIRVGQDSVADIGVFAACDLKVGDVVAKIPKEACITLRTTGAAELLKEAELEGLEGLAVALMYERSKGEASPWFGYLQLLPEKEESLPYLWSEDEIDSFLMGTEIHKAIKEEQKELRRDWMHHVVELSERNASEFSKEWFSLEHYIGAKTLLSSRAFQVDEYHGEGMVPLADLFNHKTAAEDVHFTDVPDADSDEEEDLAEEKTEPAAQGGHRYKTRQRSMQQQPSLPAETSSDGGLEGSDDEDSVSSEIGGCLEIHVVKDVAQGSEIFNTYGMRSNAALLARYGFTEPDNPYDVVNLDLSLVTQACEALLTSRHIRSRVSLWRNTGCVPTLEKGSEYFEITADGKPEAEVLLLLFLMFLPDETCGQLDRSLTPDIKGVEDVVRLVGWDEAQAPSRKLRGPSSKGRKKKKPRVDPTHLVEDDSVSAAKKAQDISNWLTTASVGEALLLVLEARDGLYPSASLDEDIEALRSISVAEKPRLFHALSVRIAERSILRRCSSRTSDWMSSLKKKRR